MMDEWYHTSTFNLLNYRHFIDHRRIVLFVSKEREKRVTPCKGTSTLLVKQSIKIPTTIHSRQSHPLYHTYLFLPS